jgi:hypothetical protein
MPVLMIGTKEQTEIATAIERARKRPTPLEAVRAGAVADKLVVKLTDRKPGFKSPAKTEQVLIPIGYCANVSFEEQPAGMCIHLSISVERDDPKMMPSIEAIRAIASEFGINFTEARLLGLMWMEEYEPGRHAVNLLKLITPTQEGHT